MLAEQEKTEQTQAPEKTAEKTGENPPPTFAQELQNLALPRRQFGYLGRGGTKAIPPQVTGHNQIGHSRAESALIPFQCLHCGLEVVGSVGLENPPSNPRFQTVSDHLLGIHAGKDQYSLGRIVFQDLPGRVHAI